MRPPTPVRRWVSRGSIAAFAVVALTAGTAAALPGAQASVHHSPGVANPYSPAYHHHYRHGVVPTIPQQRKMNQWTASHPHPLSANNLNYGGGIDGIGVTTGPQKVYLVFYGSQWGSQSTNSNGDVTLSGDPRGMAPYLQELMKGLGTGGELWSGVLTQYCDGVATGSQTCPASNTQHVGYPTGGALAGVWVDESTASPQTANGHQLGVEAVNAAAHFGNTTAASNRDAQYVVISPTGTNPDNYQTQGFCAWHDYNGDSTLSGGAVNSPYGDIAFTNLPYIPDAGASCGQNFVNSNGPLDGVSIVEGHEYAETSTDQNPPGGWTDSGGSENGDKCAWITPGTAGGSFNLSTGHGTFAMQTTWGNDGSGGAGACQASHPIVTNPGGGNTVTVTNPGNQTGTVGTPASVQIHATDSASGQTLTYSATGLPAGLSINSSSGLISGTPTTANTYSVTVKATDTTNASGSASFTWTISPATGNTVTVTNPGNQTGTVGTAVSLQIHATDSASGQTLTYSATGLPAGLSINSSSGLISGTPTTANTYSVTVKATDTTNASGSASFTWTINPSGGGGGIVNGGFETGTFSGWTTSGAATSIVSSGAHSGTYAARGGSTSPTNGDSNIAQTFTVPSGNSQLSFWYNVTCPDTVTYDWATATLKDNTAGTTTTPLSKTCVNPSSGWKQVTASVTAGHSYTLTLTSHDDNYAGDPTYTLFDDVALSSGGGGGGGIVNGGFETGTFSGWTTSGAATSVVSSGAHSGTYAARGGSTSPTNGDSNIAQTFTAASGNTTLTFWYNVTCPDTVTYDWATATLKDNTAGTTSTPLSKTCVNPSSGWKLVTASIVAGHSYTLTLTSHDDNYPGDPTYTLFDDVSTS